MTEAERNHNKAMEWASRAHIAKTKGNEEEALKHTKKALGLEVKAAELLEHEYEVEPTRSILFRSAATLAKNAGDYQVAFDLIRRALQGKPDDNTYAELISLLTNIYKDAVLQIDEKATLASAFSDKSTIKVELFKLKQFRNKYENGKIQRKSGQLSTFINDFFRDLMIQLGYPQ